MKKALIASLIALSLGVQAKTGNIDAGQKKSMVCASCHGADGNSGINPLWPKLAGQHSKYIVKQLHDFKEGRRQDGTMAPMAAPLSDQDMADLAAYFESQTRTIGEADVDKVDLGQQIYRAGNNNGVPACAACHGPAGKGNAAANFPSLSGQNADYVAKQLKDFRSGARNNDLNGMMAGIASRLSDAEIEAVAQYIQGLH